MQISDLYRQTKPGQDPVAHHGQGTFPAGRAEYNRVTSKIPEIAKVGSPREWFFRIAVLL